MRRSQRQTRSHRRRPTFHECGDEACTCAIRLIAADSESVRAYATRCAIARNHENPESEQLVEEPERFAVVETVSAEAAKLARRSNPRQWRGQTSATGPLVGRCRRRFRSSTRLPTRSCARDDGFHTVGVLGQHEEFKPKPKRKTPAKVDEPRGVLPAPKMRQLGGPQ